MAHDVFISYSSKDKPVADAICNNVEKDGIRCWIAPRDITPGSTWSEAIATAIAASKVMVVVLSTNSNASPQVLREVSLAVSNNVIIVPLRIEDITPSGAMSYYISTEHWLDAITPPMEAHIQRLTASVQTLLGREPKPSTASASPASPTPTPPAPAPSTQVPGKKFLGLTRLQLGLISSALGVVALVCLLTAGYVAFQLLTAKASPTPGSALNQTATRTPAVNKPGPTTASTSAPKPGSSTPSETALSTTPGGAQAATPGGATWLYLTDLPRNVNNIAVDPANPQVLYAAAGTRGMGGGYVYKSEDGGLTWKQAANGLKQTGVSFVAVSQDNPPVIYAIVDTEIYASRDGAQNWQKVGTNSVMGGVFPNIHLVISPANSQVFFITEPVNSFSRSLDGGQNWAPVTITGLQANVLGQTIADCLVFDPSQPNTVYVGSEGTGVYKSTDSGDTWTAANKGMLDYKISSLAIDPTNTQVLYAGSDRGELFRTQDGGQNWEDITQKVGFSAYGYTGEITDITLDASGNIYFLAQGSGLYTSQDGGENWRLLGKPDAAINATYNALDYLPGAKPVLFVSVQDSGVWRYAADQPAQAPTPTLPAPGATNPVKLPIGSWQALTDLPRFINSVAFDPSNPKMIYVGTGSYGQGGGGVYKSTDGGLTWANSSSGLGNEVVFAVATIPTTPGVVYAVVGVRGDFYASQDSGQTWRKVGVDRFAIGNMGTRIVISPKDGKVMFVVLDYGICSRSVDGGQNWAAITLGQAAEPGGQGIRVVSIAFDPADPSVVYAGTIGFGVLKSTDGGDTWNPSNKGMLDYAIKSLAVDPQHTQTVYAGGDDRNGMFKSIDGGQTWVNITASLPSQEPIQFFPAIDTIMINPAAPDTVYILVERTGLIASTDGGLTWQLVGKPGSVDYPQMNAGFMVFTPNPEMVVGFRDSGAWLYSVP